MAATIPFRAKLGSPFYPQLSEPLGNGFVRASKTAQSGSKNMGQSRAPVNQVPYPRFEAVFISQTGSMAITIWFYTTGLYFIFPDSLYALRKLPIMFRAHRGRILAVRRFGDAGFFQGAPKARPWRAVDNILNPRISGFARLMQTAAAALSIIGFARKFRFPRIIALW
ncbi:MAG TPA: hypothetical protein PLN97_12900 [Verrucomicrobiota bacterium]|jgi:hypothetical protein|nr:hypothetical protein [Verrucomicrobiota bacterium]